MAYDNMQPADEDTMDESPAEDSAPTDETESTAGGDEPKGEDSAEPTFLVSSENFGGKAPSPGDKCTFEIVACHEGECEVRYVKDSGKDASSPSGEAKNRLMGLVGKPPMRG